MADNKDIKRYKCTNYGACTKADNNEEITFNAVDTLGGIPECPGCHQHTLEEIVKKKTPFKLIAIIILAVLVLGGIGYGGYLFYESDQEEKQKEKMLQEQQEQEEEERQAMIDLAKQRADSIIADNERFMADNDARLSDGAKAVMTSHLMSLRNACQTLQYDNAGVVDEIETAINEARRNILVEINAIDIAKAKGDSIIIDNEKLLEEKGKKIRDDAKAVINAQLTSLRTLCQSLQYENIELIDTMEVAINKAWENADKPTAVAPTSVKTNLGYGTYEGPLKNGQAHGMGGTISFTRAYTIDLKKANGETVSVNAGDRMVNVKMENGRLVQGLLIRSDGSRRWIIIG